MYYLYCMGKIGAPRKYKTNEELIEVIEDYFEQNEGKLTITGLALHLGFESRQSFYDYEKKGDFAYTIKRARMVIEEYYEQALMNKNSGGAIFALKNFGWKDKSEVDNNHSGELKITRIIKK